MAHDRGLRPNATARRHMRDCAGCREFRHQLRGVSRRFAAIVPTLGPARRAGQRARASAEPGAARPAARWPRAARPGPDRRRSGSGRSAPGRARRDAARRGGGDRRRRGRAPAHAAGGAAHHHVARAAVVAHARPPAAQPGTGRHVGSSSRPTSGRRAASSSPVIARSRPPVRLTADALTAPRRASTEASGRPRPTTTIVTTKVKVRPTGGISTVISVGGVSPSAPGSGQRPPPGVGVASGPSTSARPRRRPRRRPERHLHEPGRRQRPATDVDHAAEPRPARASPHPPARSRRRHLAPTDRNGIIDGHRDRRVLDAPAVSTASRGARRRRRPTATWRRLDHEDVVGPPRARAPVSTRSSPSTRPLRGPSLGGCRMWGYEDARQALRDALRLSRAMTLQVGGRGPAARRRQGRDHDAPGDTLHAELRTAALLDFADTVESLGGRYITAEDVGTSSRDMRVIAQRTRHVAGLPRRMGGSGDPSPFTALGVESAIRACCERVFGRPIAARAQRGRGRARPRGVARSPSAAPAPAPGSC